MENVRETFKEVAAAILPVTIIVLIIQIALIRLPLESILQFLIGALFVCLGFFLFLLGVNAGLLPVGELIGRTLPKTKKPVLIILTGFFLGFAATVAEPDLRVLARQIDQVSGGDIGSELLVLTVSLGLAIFVSLALIRILFSIPIHAMMVGSYAAVFLLSLFVPEEFLPIAFDAGGVTTGPMAVPFVLALGIGSASSLSKNSARSGEGFGLIGLASVVPILAIMILGVLYR